MTNIQGTNNNIVFPYDSSLDIITTVNHNILITTHLYYHTQVNVCMCVCLCVCVNVCTQLYHSNTIDNKAMIVVSQNAKAKKGVQRKDQYLPN